MADSAEHGEREAKNADNREAELTSRAKETLSRQRQREFAKYASRGLQYFLLLR